MGLPIVAGLWPGLAPQDGLGHMEGRKNLNIFKISKVLRMGLPIVGNLSGLSGNIFNLSRIPQLHFN